MENIKLEFTDEFLKTVAKKTIHRKSGARGLRSIMEQTLIDTMYELPIKNLKEVVVDKEAIDKKAPLLIYNKTRKAKRVA